MSRSDLPTIILPPSLWNRIEPIEREVFNDPMPTITTQTSFLAAIAGDGSIAGHLRAESLLHFVHVYTDPIYRNHAALARQLMAEASELIPAGASGVWLTRVPYPHLATAFGAQFKGQFYVYRRDNH